MNLFSQETDYLKMSYTEVEKIASTCTKCELSKIRTKVVFGNGPHPCDLMLIGEAPGEQEDLQGLPFVGKAGQLLTQILESINIKRPDDIYIANTVKCRPPENRAPYPAEQAACWPYLEAQIFHLVKPKIILLAGAPAVRAVLKSDEPMSELRGKWTKLPCLPAGMAGTEIAVMPIFHPAYLLRNQSKEKGSPKWLTWQDMKEVQGALEYYRKLHSLGGGNA
jgi:DNA polymerase